MHDDLLTIGRFARLCRLSVKQLRHYDETGLLSPVHVDAGTGYRYYAPGQARDALTIALLRDMDLPLAVIARALAAGPASRARILRGERDRLAERISRDRARLAMLDRLAEDGLPGYRVTLGREPERRLAVVRAVCDPAGIGERVAECAGRLLPALAAAGTGWEPPLWGLYPLDPAERMEMAVGAPVPAEAAPPGLERQVLPGGPVVETVHTGPYAQLPLAYHALLATVHERGLRPLAPAREAYLVGPAEAPPEELMTRVVIAVEEDRT
ncbi:MerR family transcriptional regulator [Streptomyces pactum]|uniref:MerR family transcriptional regulator n=1 Tax=Streptomyces pactum TaxID=68249 RepID=A0ABS0NFA7_9ACTN|nr:GyrI-like domain-containing protein [Streptomyces pactum]MBH5333869.1 MerR family transcriptional regulator [Streptomyces pactum]